MCVGLLNQIIKTTVYSEALRYKISGKMRNFPEPIQIEIMQKKKQCEKTQYMSRE